MASGEMEDVGVGILGAAKMREGPLSENVEGRDGGVGRGASRTRKRGLANTYAGPWVARPDSMGASGSRELTEREVNTPEIDRSLMVGGIAKDDSSVEDSRGGGDGEEKLAEPEVRDNEQGFAK
jgi:hypothetical protein